MSKEKKIQCQGLPCPQPVLKCKEAIENDNPSEITVLVDNDPALENVSRFLAHQGYELHKPEKDDDSNWVIAATRSSSSAEPLIEKTAPENQSKHDNRILVFLSSDKIGNGDDELGSKLMLSFLSTLPEMGDSLWQVVMVNSGVKLSVEGSPALESLRKLEQENASLLVCGTCLEFFALTAKKRVGQTTNMLDIISSMNMADKVIAF
ncbi:sulfurtransferase-like selenium metabolism protein YedF [Desulfonatronovibrio magnus]|uniref:sulfurtransferase-like selenium metabolism protein YedF n=1 Tax=Desulfonatronovibrio magnus TaxID=698827 RepID=UPI0005EB8D7E|nr:sulfurtransferase-like selenium metabolism protein YedF [Desulfonatronovibrio magnus]